MSLKPAFTLTAGSFRSTTAAAAGGPTKMTVERHMDVAADALQVWLMRAPDVSAGDAVELKLGYAGDEETVFTGDVAGVRVGLDGCLLQAIGTMGKLLATHVSTVYEHQDAGAIVRDLIQAAGASAGDIASGPILPVFTVDRLRSSWQHARALADRLGFELFATRTGAIVFKPFGGAAQLDAGGLVSSLVSAVTGGGTGFTYGQHLVRGEVLTGNRSIDAVEVGGESPASMQGDATVHWLTTNDTDFRGRAGSGSRLLTVHDGAARTKDLADRFAAGVLARASRGLSQAAITVLGRAAVDLGDHVEAADIPSRPRVSGYVRGVRHRFGGRAGFLTDLVVAMEAAA
jgi:hypothetical protein